MDPVLAVVIIVAIVCITIVTVVLTKKERGASFIGNEADGRTGPESQAIQVSRPAPALQDITFKQALEGDALATGLENLAKRQVEYAFGLNSANAVVREVSLAARRDKLVIAYEFSHKGSNLLESGEAVIPLQSERGRFLPMLKDADTGRFTEFAPGTSRGTRKRGADVADFASLIAGLAHVIPGMEVVRRLKEIDRKLSVLAEGRKIDQLAEIETIYNRLSEIFSRENWMDRRSDLRTTRDQLFKLRATWRRELDHILDSAPGTPDTQAAEGLAKLGAVVFPPSFFIGRTLEMHRESEEAKLFGHLAATADLMQRIRLAMLLDISVSQALGEAETLAGVAMRNELEMWDGIAEKFKAKREGIRTFQPPGDLQTVEEALLGYVRMLASVTTITTAKNPEPESSDAGPLRRDYEGPSEGRPPKEYLGENAGAPALNSSNAEPEEKIIRLRR